MDQDTDTGEVEGRGKFVGPVKEETRSGLRWDKERIQFLKVFNDDPSAGSFSDATLITKRSVLIGEFSRKLEKEKM